MSTERTDQYPEVSGDEAGIVPPQGAAKQEWPKKIRTLTATELDRLTIDGLGRFYWDGKLVNYEGQNRIEPAMPPKPVDLDQHAMDLLDRTARELADPNSIHATPTIDAPQTAPAELQQEPAASSAPELAATPSDQLAPAAAAVAAVATATSPASAAPSPIVEVRRQEVLVPASARSEVVRVKLSTGQSLALFLAVVGLMAAAVGTALSGLATAHEWGCKTGMVKSYCPAPPPAPVAPPRPDIPA